VTISCQEINSVFSSVTLILSQNSDFCPIE